MSATLGGSFKQLIEGGGFGVSVHRDELPPDTFLPYCLVLEDIGGTSIELGDAGDMTSKESLVQVEVVQVWREIQNNRRVVVEDSALAENIERLINRNSLPNPPMRVLKSKVISNIRQLDKEQSIVRNVLTVQCSRMV